MSEISQDSVNKAFDCVVKVAELDPELRYKTIAAMLVAFHRVDWELLHALVEAAREYKIYKQSTVVQQMVGPTRLQ